jgi:hypothetical protein
MTKPGPLRVCKDTGVHTLSICLFGNTIATLLERWSTIRKQHSYVSSCWYQQTVLCCNAGRQSPKLILACGAGVGCRERENGMTGREHGCRLSYLHGLEVFWEDVWRQELRAD